MNLKHVNFTGNLTVGSYGMSSFTANGVTRLAVLLPSGVIHLTTPECEMFISPHSWVAAEASSGGETQRSIIDHSQVAASVTEAPVFKDHNGEVVEQPIAKNMHRSRKK